MVAWILASLLPFDPWELVRVDDPDHPEALATSAYGAILAGPPSPGTPYRWASIPEQDAWPAESAEVTNARAWHRQGATGRGVKVAVFDLGWAAGLSDPRKVEPYRTHDCWAHPSCEPPLDIEQPRFAFEENAHGWACAEVIRQVAPEVDLHLVRVNSFTQFEAAADWAIREGVDLISMSMSFYNNSFYDGGGPFKPILERLEAHDVLLITSAGNDGRAHWSGRFFDGDGDGRMDLDGENGLDLWLTEGVRTVYLNWDRHGRCGDTDLDLYVYDGRGRVVGRSTDRQLPEADRCQPVERARIFAEQTGWYRLEVHAHRGDLTFLDVDLNGRAGVQLAQTDPRGAIVDPGADPLAFTVGAVPSQDYLRAEIEPFSSWGPNHAGFPKPEIAGPNGLSASAYGPAGFFGTSASTPVVAGLIAVLMSDDPSLTPRQAARKLQDLAWSPGDAGVFSTPDPRWGAGKARLPEPEPVDGGCGRRPLIMPLFLLPLWGLRRGAGRWRSRPDGC